MLRVLSPRKNWKFRLSEMERVFRLAVLCEQTNVKVRYFKTRMKSNGINRFQVNARP